MAEVRRVQRPLDGLPPVHLKAAIPTVPETGWSVTLDGVLGAVADAAGMTEGFVVVSAAGGIYASALTLAEFRAGVFATHLDRSALRPENGGPLRFVQPPGKWAYKGVKWVTRVTGTPTFTPGFWESVVGNPLGDIPSEREDLAFEI